MSDASSSKSGLWVTFAAAVGGFAIFLIIVLIAYLPKAPEPLGDGVLTPQQRKDALIDLRAKERAAATTYGWVDQANGVVRLPIDRAVELVVNDLKSAKDQPSRSAN